MTLLLVAPSSLVSPLIRLSSYGFSIIRFGSYGISINSDDNVAQCNNIGIVADNGSVGANGTGGILITGDDNLIGGDFDTLRNLISGNSGNGIFLSGGERNDIFGNIIGLNFKASAAQANSGNGIFLAGNRNDIGGTTANLGNYIGGNGSMGIYFNPNSDYNNIFNNKIGVNIVNNPTVGNGSHGIWGLAASYNKVGSSTTGGVGNHIAGNNGFGIIFSDGSVANWIRFNTITDHASAGILISTNSDDHWITHNTIEDNDAGISITSSTSAGNTISENSIYSNNGLGIDLEGDGNVEVNDAGDGDNGPNGKQNFPELFVVGSDGIAVGKLNSLANTPFTLEFYKSPACDSSSNGEGQTYLGDWDVTTDGSGDAYFTAGFFVDVAVGDTITAIATDNLTGNSSEFSKCAPVADVFIINHAGDDGDDLTGNGTCNVNAGTVNALCTLRAAIEEVNALNPATPKKVYFAIQGTGPHTIAPATPLPSIGDKIFLDGLTYQNGADCEDGLQLFIDGDALTGSTIDGFNFNGGSAGSTVQGLAMGNFPRSAIRIRRADITVRCNYLGVNADGISVEPNLEGVTVVSNDATIGATNYPNVISANDEYGIHIDGSAAERSGMTIQSNYVGTDRTGSFDLGNLVDGIYLNDVTDSTISGNVVSGNNRYGIHLTVSDDITVDGNIAGTNASQTSALPNVTAGLKLTNSDNNVISSNIFSGNTFSGVDFTYSDNNTLTLNQIGVVGYPLSPAVIPNATGVKLTGSDHVTIGGNPTTEFNVIGGNLGDGISAHTADFIDIFGNIIGGMLGSVDAGNGGYGVYLATGTTDAQIGDYGLGNTISHNDEGIGMVLDITVRNSIAGNSIFDNDDLGIDLNNDGVDTNDSGDVDGGTNGTQNFATLSHASTNLGGVQVRGSLLYGSSFPYTVDYYSVDSCDSSGNGEGKTYLGSLELATNVADFYAVVNAPPVGENNITSIVTDNAGNSSEFSACRAVTACTPPTVKDPTLSVNGAGIDILFDWSSSDNYYIYRSVNDPYGEKSAYGYQSFGSTWTDIGGAGNVANNYYYQTRNRHICISDLSKIVGEFDFAIVPGTP